MPTGTAVCSSHGTLSRFREDDSGMVWGWGRFRGDSGPMSDFWEWIGDGDDFWDDSGWE